MRTASVRETPGASRYGGTPVHRTGPIQLDVRSRTRART
jgi:hypothetical protein